MKTIYLLRHAKSAWDQPDLEDHDRPLDDRGQRAAAVMAVYIGQAGLRPDSVLCSTATRTRQTLERVQAVLGTPMIRYDPGVYLADAKRLLARLQDQPATCASLLVIGHNPGMEELAGWLVGSGDKALRAKMRAKFPTAALAVIEAAIDDWRELAPGRGRLVDFRTPKDLV